MRRWLALVCPKGTQIYTIFLNICTDHIRYVKYMVFFTSLRQRLQMKIALKSIFCLIYCFSHGPNKKNPSRPIGWESLVSHCHNGVIATSTTVLIARVIATSTTMVTQKEAASKNQHLYQNNYT